MKDTKKTIVIGASENPTRYAYKAIKQLAENGHEVIPIGVRSGNVLGYEIRTDRPVIEDVDTVSLYIRPTIQEDYQEYIWSINPRRIIFNPGTENPKLMKLAREKGILTEAACTLVLLSIGDY